MEESITECQIVLQVYKVKSENLLLMIPLRIKPEIILLSITNKIVIIDGFFFSGKPEAVC